jgi:hypothetical protein
VSTSQRSAWQPRERAFDAGRVSALRLLLCVLIVFASAAFLARRFELLAADAERASLQQSTHALRLAVQAAALTGAARGSPSEAAALVDGNPMLLLESPLPNYSGEGSGPDCERRGHWCFDLGARELVYFPEAQLGSTSESQSSGVIRLKIAEGTSEGTGDSGVASRGFPRLVALEAPAWLEGSSAAASLAR